MTPVSTMILAMEFNKSDFLCSLLAQEVLVIQSVISLI